MSYKDMLWEVGINKADGREVIVTDIINKGLVKVYRYDEKEFNTNISRFRHGESYEKFDWSGRINTAKNGQLMKIIDYNGPLNVTVEFEDGTVVRNKPLSRFRSGSIRNPQKTKKLSTESIKPEMIGVENIASNGQKMKITCYRNKDSIDVVFDDGTIVMDKAMKQFRCGKIENPNKKAKRGKGHVGEVRYNKVYGMNMCIIAYRGYNDIDIQFEDKVIVKNRTYVHFVNGEISRGDAKKKIGSFDIINKVLEYEGDTYYHCKCSKCKCENILSTKEMLGHKC